MRRREFLSRVMACGLAGGTSACVTGCGTLFHSDRCGQPHSNQIDWKIAAADGLGLMLFFVPGVVAFAVDFYTGAIYLPPTPMPYAPDYPPPESPGYPSFTQQPQPLPPHPQQNPHVGNQPTRQAAVPVTPAQPVPNTLGAAVPSRTPHSVALRRVPVPRHELQPRTIQHVVTNYLGRPVPLDQPEARVSRLPRLDRFADQCHRHHSERNFGQSVQGFLQRWQHA